MKLLVGVSHTYPVGNSLLMYHENFFTYVNLRCGVSKGSILGPLLFLLYINDMPQAVDCDLFLYADDT